MSKIDMNGRNETGDIVYTDVNDHESQVIMSERKFSIKSQEKECLDVAIDDSNLRRMNYRTGESPPIHLALFFSLQVR